MDNLGAGLSAAGTALSAVGSIQEGNATYKASKAAAKAVKEGAKFEAAQLNRNAGQQRATAQREAIEQRRAGRLAQSRALAVAGASGAGVSDVDVTNLVSDLAADGEYNALTALYNGEEQALGMEDQAKGVMYNAKQEARSYKAKGKAAKSAGYMTALGTAIEGATSFLEKYGGN